MRVRDCFLQIANGWLGTLVVKLNINLSPTFKFTCGLIEPFKAKVWLYVVGFPLGQVEPWTHPTKVTLYVTSFAETLNNATKINTTQNKPDKRAICLVSDENKINV